MSHYFLFLVNNSKKSKKYWKNGNSKNPIKPKISLLRKTPKKIPKSNKNSKNPQNFKQIHSQKTRRRKFNKST
jgi:hypothetical protein